MLFSVTSVFSVVQLAIDAPSHPVGSIPFGDTPSGRHETSGIPRVLPKEMNFARRDRLSLPWFGLRRARSARPRPSASGLHERSAADEAGAAEPEPCRLRARLFVGGLLSTDLAPSNAQKIPR
jgi:hypothetical protein